MSIENIDAFNYTIGYLLASMEQAEIRGNNYCASLMKHMIDFLSEEVDKILNPAAYNDE